jgi:capsule polysaccharide export protein KpsE/RkpR
MELAILKFHSKVLDINIFTEVNFLTIKVTTDDKYFSRDLAQYYLDLLIDYTINTSHNIGRQKRELLESRINQILEQIATLTLEISEYQKTHNIIEIEQQAKISLESYGRVLEEFISNEFELNHAERFMPNSPMHQTLLDKRESLVETLQKLQVDNSDMPFFIPLSDINNSFFTIQEKVFSLELQRKILEALYPQLELARLEELDNTDRFEIIDLPNLAGQRSFPKRALICIITFMFSFIFSVCCVLIKHLIKR